MIVPTFWKKRGFNLTDNKISPFDFISSVSHTKKNLIDDADDPKEAIRQYNAFMVNKGLSHFNDTVLHANEMNMWHLLPDEAQYTYYLNILRPRKRFSKWFKGDQDKNLQMVREYFQCNISVAKQYLKILTEVQITKIKEKMQEGGTNNGRKRK